MILDNDDLALIAELLQERIDHRVNSASAVRDRILAKGDTYGGRSAKEYAALLTSEADQARSTLDKIVEMKREIG